MFDTLKFKFWAWLARTLAEDPKTCEHKWDVVCGILSDVAIQVQCVKCGTWGSVPDPSLEEWTACSDAYENPYPWEDGSRVEFSLGESAD